MKNYDVAIIGAGSAGIFAAYELSKLTNLRILLIEKGNLLKNRKCPIKGTSKKCCNCHECSIMTGFGGAGGFSDGKYNITTEFGGWLSEYISDEEVLDLINYVDSINVKFGATEKSYSTENKKAKEFSKKAHQNGLHLLKATVKHLGTEENYKILTKIYEHLKDRVDIKCNFEVDKISCLSNRSKKYKYALDMIDGSVIKCKYLIVAPGRSGAEWFAKQCKSLGLKLTNNQVDIGVRVELPNEIFEDITDSVYEAKLKYLTKGHGNFVRTFCMNPSGYVVTENTEGIMTVNGHSYKDKALGSENTNFAILVSTKFTEPFNDPYQYGKRIASFSNMLGDGIIVQRFGDLKNGRRTNEERMKKCFTKPTLKSATPGDLGYIIPKNQLDDVVEMIEALDKIIPGTANDDTLLYGVEVKFYSSKPYLSNVLETEHKNMFAIGDGAGVTRGLAQAGASGILVAREIANREKCNN